MQEWRTWRESVGEAIIGQGQHTQAVVSHQLVHLPDHGEQDGLAVVCVCWA